MAREGAPEEEPSVVVSRELAKKAGSEGVHPEHGVGTTEKQEVAQVKEKRIREAKDVMGFIDVVKQLGIVHSSSGKESSKEVARKVRDTYFGAKGLIDAAVKGGGVSPSDSLLHGVEMGIGSITRSYGIRDTLRGMLETYQKELAETAGTMTDDEALDASKAYLKAHPKATYGEVAKALGQDLKDVKPSIKKAREQLETEEALMKDEEVKVFTEEEEREFEATNRARRDGKSVDVPPTPPPLTLEMLAEEADEKAAEDFEITVEEPEEKKPEADLDFEITEAEADVEALIATPAVEGATEMEVVSEASVELTPAEQKIVEQAEKLAEKKPGILKQISGWLARRKEAMGRLEAKKKAETEIWEDVDLSDLEPKLQEAAKEVLTEVKALPEAKKLEIGRGLKNLGFLANETKARIFSKMLGKASESATDGTLKRFLGSLGETYQRDAARARKAMETPKLLAKAGNIGALISWGRIAYDLGVVGSARLLNPFRHVTAGAVVLGRGLEAAKEARMKNTELKDKTRIADVDAAAEEAWRVYEEAQKRGDISKDALNKAYLDQMPQDLLRRLQEKPDGVVTNVLARIFQKDVLWGVKSIEKKLDLINKGELPTIAGRTLRRVKSFVGRGPEGGLSNEEKQAAREQLLDSYKKFLNDADRLVGQASGVDILGYTARLGQQAAEFTRNAMILDSLRLAATGLMHLSERYFGSDATGEHVQAAAEQVKASASAGVFGGKTFAGLVQERVSAAEAAAETDHIPAGGHVAEGAPHAEVSHAVPEHPAVPAEASHPIEPAPAHEVVAPVERAAPELPHEAPKGMDASLTTGTVKTGDGIGPVAMRQLEQMGVTGDKARLAKKLLKAAGLDKQWLSEKAVGHLSVTVEGQGKDMHLAFHDPTTGAELSKGDLEKQGFLMKPMESVPEVITPEVNTKGVKIAYDVLGREKFAQLSGDQRREVGSLLRQVDLAQEDIKRAIKDGNKALRKAAEARSESLENKLDKGYGTVLPKSWFADLNKHEHGSSDGEVAKEALADRGEKIPEPPPAPEKVDEVGGVMPTKPDVIRSMLSEHHGKMNVKGILYESKGGKIVFYLPGEKEEIPLTAKTGKVLEAYQKLLKNTNSEGKINPDALKTFQKMVEESTVPEAAPVPEAKVPVAEGGPTEVGLKTAMTEILRPQPEAKEYINGLVKAGEEHAKKTWAEIFGTSDLAKANITSDDLFPKDAAFNRAQLEEGAKLVRRDVSIDSLQKIASGPAVEGKQIELKSAGGSKFFLSINYDIKRAARLMLEKINKSS